MLFKILISDAKVWQKDLTRINPAEYARIKKRIKALANFPDSGDIKKLVNAETADYRLRIGKYRVLFDVDQPRKIILLYRILHRRVVYQI